jgi:hypothetical protein
VSLYERVREMWDIDQDWPTPKFAVLCPLCRSPDTMIRRWSYCESPKSPRPWRCDVHFKCRSCSMTWACGVAVPEERYPGRIVKYHGGDIEPVGATSMKGSKV